MGGARFFAFERTCLKIFLRKLMKKSKRPKKAAAAIEVTLSDTVAGIARLKTLTEPVFRDQVLNHLFTRMKKDGAIDAFQNIHGRNDKGIDYLLAQTTA